MLTNRALLTKWGLYALGFLLLVLVQQLVLDHLPALLGATPFLMPMLVAVVAALEGPTGGTIFGIAVGFLSDLAGGGVFSGVYTLSLAGFQFSEWDFLPGESDPSPLMAAILDAAGGRRPPSPHRALLSLYLDESTRDSLPVSSQVTITLRLTGDEAHPFQYLSCQRSSPLPSQS